MGTCRQRQEGLGPWAVTPGWAAVGRQEEQLPVLGRAARAGLLLQEVGIKAASTQAHGGVQIKGVRGRRAGVELGLADLCLCKRRGGRRQTGSPGQLREVAARGSGGMLAAAGHSELGMEMLHLHPFLLGKPSCSTLDFSKITWVMREKKYKSISSIRPLFFVSHTPSSLGRRGHGGPTSTSPLITLPWGRPSPNWATGAVGKTLSVNL